MGITDNEGNVLLTPIEAGEHLGVSRAAAYRLIKSGVLKKVKKKGVRQIFVTLSSVQRYKEGQGMSHKELVERVLKLEQLVHNLAMTRAKTEYLTPSQANQSHDPMVVDNLLRRNHPELFDN